MYVKNHLTLEMTRGTSCVIWTVCSIIHFIIMVSMVCHSQTHHWRLCHKVVHYYSTVWLYVIWHCHFFNHYTFLEVLVTHSIIIIVTISLWPAGPSLCIDCLPWGFLCCKCIVFTILVLVSIVISNSSSLAIIITILLNLCDCAHNVSDSANTVD